LYFLKQTGVFKEIQEYFIKQAAAVKFFVDRIKLSKIFPMI